MRFVQFIGSSVGNTNIPPILKRAAGWVRRGINLSPDAQAALAAIRDRDGVTVDEAVQAALLAWAGQTERGKP